MSRPGPPRSAHAISASAPLPAIPYKGLLPFAEGDAELFFGRVADADIVIANLLASRFTLLYGASGVGKTSLLHAGVIHDLYAASRRDLAERGAPEFVAVLVSDWADDPVTTVLEGVRRSVTELLGEPAGKPDTQVPLGQALAWWTHQLNADLLLMFDQFEEYFLYHGHEDGEGTFAVELPGLITRPDLRVSVLLSIREDAVTRLDRFQDRIPGLFENILRVEHLGREAGRDAIEKPLEAHHLLHPGQEPVIAEAELVEAVLEEIQVGKVTLSATGRGGVEPGPSTTLTDQRIEAPYLQLVMTRLWEEEARQDSRTLRLGTLRRLGGAEQIVRTHLDTAIGTLPESEQDVAASMFHFLVTPSGSKVSHTASDLAEYVEFSESDVVKVLRKLSRADARILRPVAPSLERPNEPRYEIFHDVLAPAILDWRARHVEARKADARLAARLEEEAKATRAAEERARAYRRTARITRAFALAMAIMLVLVTVLALLILRTQALRRSDELTAAALAELPRDPAASLRLAVRAVHAKHTSQAELALRRTVDETRLRVVMRSHRDWVTSAIFSPDGRHVLTGSNDRTARIWNAATGENLATVDLPDNPNPLAHPQFDDDGQTVLVVTIDGTASIWDWQRGNNLVKLDGRFLSAALSHQGSRVVTGDERGRVQVWDSRMGQDKYRIKINSAANIVTFNKAGTRVAVGEANGSITLWHVERGIRQTLRTSRKSGAVKSLAWNAFDDQLAVGSNDGSARIWNVKGPNPKLERTLPGPRREGPVTEIAFSQPYSNSVFTVAGKAVRVWNTVNPKKGERPIELLGHNASVLDAAFADSPISTEESLLVSASADGTARVWDTTSGRTVVGLRGHSDSIFGVDIYVDPRTNDQRVVTAGADGSARIWDVGMGRRYGNHRGGVNVAAFDARGGTIVTGGADGRVVVSDLEGRFGTDITFTRRSNSNAVTSAAISDDGSMIVAGTIDGRIEVWNLRGKRVAALNLQSDDLISSVAFDHGPTADRVVLTAGFTGRTEVWNWRHGAKTIILQASSTTSQGSAAVRRIFSAVFSPDNNQILTAHADKTARLYDATSGRQIREFRGHSSIVYSAAFSRSGRYIVTAGGDGEVRIWETATGTLVKTLVGQSSAVRSASFSQDERLVVAGDTDGTTLIWNATTGETLGVLHRHSDSINSAAFAPDGAILTASDDGTAKVYRCETCGSLDDLLETAHEYQRYVR
jgi:WD40 repeat protein